MSACTGAGVAEGCALASVTAGADGTGVAAAKASPTMPPLITMTGSVRPGRLCPALPGAGIADTFSPVTAGAAAPRRTIERIAAGSVFSTLTMDEALASPAIAVNDSSAIANTRMIGKSVATLEAH